MSAEHDFVTLVLTRELEVAAPAAWAEIGAFRHIERWMDAKCSYRSGDGGIGTVRVVSVAGNVYEEVQTSRTDLAYSYAPLQMFLPFYHAALSVVALGESRSKIDYSFLWDEAGLSKDARQIARDTVLQAFEPALENMKRIAERR